MKTPEQIAQDAALRVCAAMSYEKVVDIILAMHAHSNDELQRRREVEVENVRLRRLVEYQAVQELAGSWACEKWGRDIKQRLRKLLEEAAECMCAHSDFRELRKELGDLDLVRASILRALNEMAISFPPSEQFEQRAMLQAALERAKAKHGE